jgi:hypothetical protein
VFCLFRSCTLAYSYQSPSLCLALVFLLLFFFPSLLCDKGKVGWEHLSFFLFPDLLGNELGVGHKVGDALQHASWLEDKGWEGDPMEVHALAELRDDSHEDAAGAVVQDLCVLALHWDVVGGVVACHRSCTLLRVSTCSLVGSVGGESCCRVMRIEQEWEGKGNRNKKNE